MSKADEKDSIAGELRPDMLHPAQEVTTDVDPAETQEWLDSLGYVLENKGRERAAFLLSALRRKALLKGVEVPVQATTPYVNSITQDQQPPYPGNRELERRIKSINRWNAMAM